MVITVQESIKRRQGKLLLACLALALLLQLQLFLLTPTYTPRAYRLEEVPFEVIDIPDEVEIIEIPETVMPQPYRDIIIEEGDGEELDIAPTNIDCIDLYLPPNPAGLYRSAHRFIAFDEAPIVTYRAPVGYPRLAREAEMEGTVLLKVFIDARGNVIDARVLSTSAPSLLVSAAIASVRKWRFQPGKQRNIPVPTKITVPVDFRLR